MARRPSVASLTKEAAVFVAPDFLVPWEKNPRFNDPAVDLIVESIREFGFGAPLVANASDRMIIAGHTRWKAACALGLKEIPVRFLDLPPEKAKALALADNRLGEVAVWDEPILREVLRELQNTDVALPVLGFDEANLAALLREELFIPEGTPQEEPTMVSECAVEIRCTRSALEDFKGTLSEWSKRGDTTVNIS